MVATGRIGGFSVMPSLVMNPPCPSLKEAIDTWCRERIEVYRASRDQIRVDANSADATMRDHVDRWMLELIQNAEDAGADRVKIQITSGALYVADNGQGLSPNSIRSISALHLSDKPAHAIGRKGLGFKAVYSVTNTPSVFTGADSIHFDPEWARRFLENHDFTGLAKIPHSWLPCWQARQQDEVEDEALRALSEFRTVVRLPFGVKSTAEQANAQLATLSAYTLLTFRHLRRVEIDGVSGSRMLEVCLRREGVWSVKTDTDDQAWRVLSHHGVKTPAAALREFPDPDDRARCESVSVLVASLLDENGVPTCVHINRKTPALHVFYPTEIPAPVDLVLHADFVTKSDRTAIVPFDGSPFNSWLTERLAACVVNFAQNTTSIDHPEAGLLLLKPTQEAASEGLLTQAMWERIAAAAKARFLVPNFVGRPVLRVSDAAVLGSDFPGRSTARTLLAADRMLRRRLVHARIEDSTAAVAVLVRLGGIQLQVNDVLDCLEKLLPTSNAELLWSAIDWLSQWLNQPKSAQGGEAVVERMARLKVLALEEGTCVSKNDLRDSDTFVTWRDGSWDKNLPDWMPLRFIAPWLKDRLEGLPENSPIKHLLDDFRLKTPSKDLVLRAFSSATRNYWDQQDGAPERFLEFLSQVDVDLDPGAAKHVTRCPVRATVDGQHAWIPADQAYFGAEWGNDLLAEVYRGMPGIGWLKPPDGDKQIWADFFETLGVSRWPRLVEDVSEKGKQDERQRVLARVGFWGTEIAPPVRLDRVDPAQMTRGAFASLLGLIAKHWLHYRLKERFQVYGRSVRRTVYADCKFLWWEQVLHHAAPCLADGPGGTLEQSWLPEESIRSELRPLLPILDAASFGEHWPTVREWLRSRNTVRQSLVQLPMLQWQQAFEERLPLRYPASAGSESYQAAIRCYEAALLAWSENQHLAAEPMSIKLLARRGGEYAYVEPSFIWIADDVLLEQAFADVVWLISFPANLQNAAAHHFGLKWLSQRESRPNWTESSGQYAIDLTERVHCTAPYILAKRSNDAPAQRDQFLAKLRAVAVRRVERLIEQVSLPGISIGKEVERRWALAGCTIFVGHGNLETNLGEALAALLDRESDADLYEILLGCETDDARRSKLEQRDVPGDHLDGCLKEFSAATTVPPQIIASLPEVGTTTRPRTANDRVPFTHPDRTPPIAQPGAASPANRPAMSLKELAEGNWRMEHGAPKATAADAPSAPRRDIEVSESGTSLSSEQRHEVEIRGRAFAEAELRRCGYVVQQMPFANPGYDLAAKKDGELLHLEVKAHRGRASVVELTEREWQAYLDSRADGSAFRWQLWNVENLSSEIADQVVITSYNDLPKVALRNTSYRLDLKHCGVLP